ncbi:unnamed protein product [Lymnaea stagnalis]|uniref:EF-hand domain-containing protein n=2 Tax=Lymnaea stagnalis TaxID=6523 RepID=A0AAV2H3E7_LYMST
MYSFGVVRWPILLLGFLMTTTCTRGDHFRLATFKRSAMDLAMMQVYRICDIDKNGLFTRQELMCVQKVIQILFTGR